MDGDPLLRIAPLLLGVGFFVWIGRAYWLAITSTLRHHRIAVGQCPTRRLVRVYQVGGLWAHILQQKLATAEAPSSLAISTAARVLTRIFVLGGESIGP